MASFSISIIDYLSPIFHMNVSRNIFFEERKPMQVDHPLLILIWDRVNQGEASAFESSAFEVESNNHVTVVLMVVSIIKVSI